MLIDMLISLINFVISALGILLNTLMNLLPSSPFSSVVVNNISNEYLSYLAWVIPFESIISIFSSSLLAVGIYYIYQVGLRWVKAVE